MSRPKIELTDQQKFVIEIDCCLKPLDYISFETGLSKYKIRQYIKEYHQKELKRIEKQWNDFNESHQES